MVDRPQWRLHIRRALRRSRIGVLLGPRQIGKTTLARALVTGESPNSFDLEDRTSLARLDQPMTALQGLRGTVAIDEIQRRADLFPVPRVLADRLEIIDVPGLSLAEVGTRSLNRYWQRGGFPLSYLARANDDSLTWRRQFIQAFLERDLPQLGVSIPATALLRFWTMAVHDHGGIWSSADPARSLGLGESTVRCYLDLLTQSLVVRQLQPWHENLAKRQVKSPKVYVRDSGLLHALLGIRSERAPMSGRREAT